MYKVSSAVLLFELSASQKEETRGAWTVSTLEKIQRLCQERIVF